MPCYCQSGMCNDAADDEKTERYPLSEGIRFWLLCGQHSELQLTQQSIDPAKWF